MDKIELNTFACACYEHNTLDELRKALRYRKADPTDCQNWGITPTEWREGIRLAIAHRLADGYKCTA